MYNTIRRKDRRMVIPDIVQFWGAIILIVSFGILAIYIWLKETFIGAFIEHQKETGKKYSKTFWSFLWLIGLLIILFVSFMYLKYGIPLF